MPEIPELKKSDLKLLLESIKYKGGMITGGDCKAGCKYCYLRQGKHKKNYVPLNIPFISKKDFRIALDAAARYNQKALTLGDGVDIISSEPFIHPYIYEFIEELEVAPHINSVLITTNGLYITKDKYDFLKNCKKLRWIASCSSLTEEGRKNVVTTKRCDRLLDFLSFLHDDSGHYLNSLQLTVYNLEYFIKDMEIVKKRFPKFLGRVYIRELAYNKFFSKEAKAVIDHCRRAFKDVLRYCAKNKIRLRWDDTSLDEDFDLKSNFPGFKNSVKSFVAHVNMAVFNCLKMNFKSPVLCVPDSCYFLIPRVKKDFVIPKMKKKFLRIQNMTFGGNYKCYGLMTLDDISRALKKTNLKKHDVVVFKRGFLNKDDLDLRREHIRELKKRFDIPFMVTTTGRDAKLL